MCSLFPQDTNFIELSKDNVPRPIRGIVLALFALTYVPQNSHLSLHSLDYVLFMIIHGLTSILAFFTTHGYLENLQRAIALNLAQRRRNALHLSTARNPFGIQGGFMNGSSLSSIHWFAVPANIISLGRVYASYSISSSWAIVRRIYAKVLQITVKFGQVYLEAWEIGQRHVVCLPLVLEAFHDFLVDLVVLIGIEILCELLRNVRVVVYWKSAGRPGTLIPAEFIDGRNVGVNALPLRFSLPLTTATNTPPIEPAHSRGNPLRASHRARIHRNAGPRPFGTRSPVFQLPSPPSSVRPSCVPRSSLGQMFACLPRSGSDVFGTTSAHPETPVRPWAITSPCATRAFSVSPTPTGTGFSTPAISPSSGPMTPKSDRPLPSFFQYPTPVKVVISAPLGRRRRHRRGKGKRGVKTVDPTELDESLKVDATLDTIKSSEGVMKRDKTSGVDCGI